MAIILRAVPIVALLAAVVPSHSDAQNAATPSLKRSAVVQGEFVRIGDLIENAGATSDVAIFRAPDLGITGSVATAKVLEAVRPYQLYAVETAGIAAIEVTRASRVIGGKDIESRIARAFAGQYGLGDAKRLTVNLEREAHAIYVDPNSMAELEVTRSSFDPRSGRFDISFDLTGTVATSRAPLRFTGTLFEGVEAAVLTRPLGRGEIVKATDVTIERRPKSEVANDTIASLDQIVGFSARQALRAGQVLRRGDVLKADVVQRNDAVTLVYEVPGIVLTVRGKAVDAGAEGDVIGVLNVQTKRTVQGTVAGPGRVIVTPAPAISSAVVAAQVPSTE